MSFRYELLKISKIGFKPIRVTANINLKTIEERLNQKDE